MSWPNSVVQGNRVKQTYIQGFLDISGGDITLRNQGSLHIGNGIDICGNIYIGSNSTIKGNTYIGKNSTIDGNSIVVSNSTIVGNSTVVGNLGVNTNTKLSGNLIVGNNINVNLSYLFDISSNSSNIQAIPAPYFFTENHLDINAITTPGNGTQYQNLTFKNGGYDASCSTYLNNSNAFNAYNAFNGSTLTYWQSDNNYDLAGNYTGIKNTQIQEITISGEFLDIYLPYYLLLNSFSIASCSNTSLGSPKKFYVLGSNTKQSWTILYDNSYVIPVTNPFNVSNYSINYTPNVSVNSQQFQYFRLHVASTYTSSSTIINQFNLYGTPYTAINAKIPLNTISWLNYGISSFDLLDSSSASISTTKYVSGLGNNSLYLRNSSNYLVLPKFSLFNCSGFSICFWINFNELPTTITGKIFELNSGDNTGQISLDTSFNISGKYINFIPTINTWHHISLCHSYSQNNMIMYLNGLYNQEISNISFVYSDYFVNYLGRTNNGISNCNLYMDDFRIYNSNLNSFQINAIYNTNQTINTNNLLSYNFNNAYFGSNVNIYNDLSLNGNFNIVSGNIVTTSGNTANIFITNSGKISLGTNTDNIFVGKSSSTGKVFFNNDVSMAGNLTVAGGNIVTTSANSGNIFTTNTGIISLGTSSGNIFVGTSSTGQVIFNNDVSMNGNLNIVTGNIITSTSTGTANLFTTNSGTISLGTNTNTIYVGKTTTGQVIFNNDVSMNGNLNIVTGNIITSTSTGTANLFTTNSGTISLGTNTDKIVIGKSSTTVHLNDISMNGKIKFSKGGQITDTDTSTTTITGPGTASSRKVSIEDYLKISSLYIGGSPTPGADAAYIQLASSALNIYGYNSSSVLSTNIYGNLTLAGDGTQGNTLYSCAINTQNNSITCGLGSISATSYNATSDYRIKENIREIQYTVDNLKPIHYTNKNTKKDDIGLIAHELQEIIPFLVTGEKDGKENQTINYIGLIGVLIKEIQDLKKRVSILEEK